MGAWAYISSYTPLAIKRELNHAYKRAYKKNKSNKL